mgnify:CR=1 FL=1
MKREIKCNYSFPFTENDKDKLKSVGPKTRNLIEMRRIGLPVPEGYAISDEVYDIFQ